MGIQGLAAFIKKKHPEGIQVWPGTMRRMRVAVDCTLYLCRLFFAQTNILTPEDLAAAYLIFARQLEEKNFDCIHVYDGVSSVLKRYAHERRQDAREDGIESLELARRQLIEAAYWVQMHVSDKLTDTRHTVCTCDDTPSLDISSIPSDIYDMPGYADQVYEMVAKTPDVVICFSLSSSQRALVHAFLDMWERVNILSCRFERVINRTVQLAAIDMMRDQMVFHTSEDEAEQECARMCRKGEVEAVLTEDIDALVFGAPLVIRGITTMEPSMMRLDDILRGLDMTPERFLDVCILSGSDFTPKPAGFGPATSVKALTKYESLVYMCMHPKECFGKWSDSEWMGFANAVKDAWNKFADNWIEGTGEWPMVSARTWPDLLVTCSLTG